MYSTSLPRPIPLSPSLPESWVGELVQLWQRVAAQQRQRAHVAAAAELSERMLLDIGTPDELLLEAHARREANELRASELRLGLGRGMF
jgi:uncharacterized protein YjiS (DUF1127 family)